MPATGLKPPWWPQPMDSCYTCQYAGLVCHVWDSKIHAGMLLLVAFFDAIMRTCASALQAHPAVRYLVGAGQAATCIALSA